MQKLFKIEKLFFLITLLFFSLHTFAQESEYDYAEKMSIETNIFMSAVNENEKDYMDYSIDSSLKENIIPKEKLLHDSSKVIHSKSNTRGQSQNIKANVKISSDKNHVRPWLFVIFPIVVLFIIFKIIKSRKA